MTRESQRKLFADKHPTVKFRFVDFDGVRREAIERVANHKLYRGFFDTGRLPSRIAFFT